MERVRGPRILAVPLSCRVSLYSPAEARAAGISIPTTFSTREDSTPTPGAGLHFRSWQSAAAALSSGGGLRESPRAILFRRQLKVTRNLTLNFAAAYSFEDNLVNHVSSETSGPVQAS
jgi:hypothetical protein